MDGVGQGVVQPAASPNITNQAAAAAANLIQLQPQAFPHPALTQIQQLQRQQQLQQQQQQRMQWQQQQQLQQQLQMQQLQVSHKLE